MPLMCESNRVISPDARRRSRTDSNECAEFDVFSGARAFEDMQPSETELTTFYYDSDPLAEYINLRELGKSTPDIFQDIVASRATPDELIRPMPRLKKPTLQHHDLANTIRRHFSNKYLMMRLHNTKNVYGTIVSKFQCDVEKMLETPLVLRGQDVAAFCKLYDFYFEDKATEAIFNKARSFPEYTDGYYVDHEVTFAGSVERKSKDSSYTTYYWLTESKHLIEKRVKFSNAEGPVWKYLSSKGRIKLRGQLYTSKKIGHDFRLARIIGGNYEIYD